VIPPPYEGGGQVGVEETCADNYPNPPLTPPFISGENLLSIHVLHGTSQLSAGIEVRQLSASPRGLKPTNSDAG
jgi:hypothetical protein